MRYFRHIKLNKLLLLAIFLLPIGLSTISLVHAMEMDHDVHEQHQCEIYDAINHALSTPLLLEVCPDKAQCFQTFHTLGATVNSKDLPRTRSPPASV